MKNFLKLDSCLEVMPLLLELQTKPHLWNRNDARLSEKGPHRETSDIWVRYKDEAENKKHNDYSNFGDPHDGVWYPAYYALPSLRKLIFDLMARVYGERLGGVLIYKIPPGKKIYPHTDTGWHVDYYDKFNICLQTNEDTVFFYKDEKMMARQGDLHWFANNVGHWIENNGESEDYICLTVCIRTHEYETRFRDVSGT